MANSKSSRASSDAETMSASAPVVTTESPKSDKHNIADTNASWKAMMCQWEDKEKAAEAGRIGGVKSGQVRRKRRLMREAAQQILSADLSALPLPELEDLRLSLKVLGVDDATGADVILLAQSIKAARGDTEAARFVRDTSGEKPSVAVDVTAADRTIDKDSVAELSDAELIALADGAEDAHALPPPMLQ